MITPRKDIPSAPPSEEAETREALQRLAAPLHKPYGTWRNFDTPTAALRAVITEIGDVVLARTIEIMSDGAHQTFGLTISNRHLVMLSGLPVNPETADATTIVKHIGVALAGTQRVKFDIVSRTPVLPSSARSWSCKALMEALGTDDKFATHAVIGAPVLKAVKAKAIAWLQPTSEKETGSGEALAALRRVAASHAQLAEDQAQIRRKTPQMSLISLSPALLCVEITLTDDTLIGLCDANDQTDLIDVWRQYVAATQSD
ncbi:hypothetical protein [Shimia sagamensis]|uniref:Uncharacterized protein n=1 Tax=Shimia sagamensis TaxID=1566352 RepID=A0ABY1PCT4_9RHOB|nr:hypothetical protein [Shimia sagamensis]SMP31034.1 hypothetical protein SAMN06265373_107190 [Shimia sagamensis]